MIISWLIWCVTGVWLEKNPYVVGIIPALINNFLGGLF
jgi:hypothetical protein